MPSGDANDIMWYPDMVASAHMTPNEGILSSGTTYHGTNNGIVANGTQFPITKTGNIHLQSKLNPLLLKSAYVVPKTET